MIKDLSISVSIIKSTIKFKNLYDMEVSKIEYIYNQHPNKISFQLESNPFI